MKLVAFKTPKIIYKHVKMTPVLTNYLFIDLNRDKLLAEMIGCCFSSRAVVKNNTSQYFATVAYDRMLRAFIGMCLYMNTLIRISLAITPSLVSLRNV